MKLAAALVGVSAVSANFANIANYAPGSDVVPHSMIDLDVKDMAALAGSFDFTGAGEIYANGANSAKTDSMRALKKFSDNSEKLKGEKMADMYAAYWGGDYGYADAFVQAALTDTTLEDVARKEMAVKGTQYQVVWMYVLHELYDAIGDCEGSTIQDNDAGVHAWDEGWAFYAGSLMLADGSGSGQLLYTLANKRCSNFGTCDADTGNSGVNAKLLPLFQKGEVALQSGKCSEAKVLLQKIIPLMTVPLVQGALRYAYKADPNGGAGGAKERAEGWAFAAAVLPQIDNVSPAAATLIRSNLDYNAATPVVDGYAAVYKAFQDTYTALGFSCEDVGGLLETDTTYYADTGPCNDAIAGYVPGSNVVPHAMIDLDVKDMAALAGSYDFTGAGEIYANGANSAKSDSMRTLKKFSDNSEKLKGEKMADMYAAYWGGDYGYADAFVQAALTDTTLEDVARKEMAVKGTQYQVVWMYVLHELYDAIGDCEGSTIQDNDLGVHAWDEGWAFYAGSLMLADGSGSGQLLYTLANKRCSNFGTCDADTGNSGVNAMLLPLFQKGEVALQSGKCSEAKELLQEIIPLMTVPLVQGALRYAYKADPNGGAGGAKERAEGWAFAAAVLPQIDSVDPAAATLIRSNLDYDAATPVADGYAAVYKAFQDTYMALGLSCEDVGGLLETDTTYYTDTAPCDDAKLPGYSASARAASYSPLVLLALGVLALVR